MLWMDRLYMRMPLWLRTCISILGDLFEWGVDRLPFRGRLCWLLKHKYPVLWFKSDNPDAQSGIADTEAGCVFCKYTKNNTHSMYENEIDYVATKHRTTPPKHRVFAPPFIKSLSI